MNKEELTEVLKQHKLWLDSGGVRGERADLRYADLSNADLRYADLSNADLSGADLSDADLSDANLRNANLRNADLSVAILRNANLRNANLRNANLRNAYLRNAYLIGANLRNANLRNANLRNAYLEGVKGLHFQIPQEGELTVFKKLTDLRIAKLLIPSEAKRTATPVSRKCRAECVKVLSITSLDGKKSYDEGSSAHSRRTVYKVGEVVYPDLYDDDWRVECTNGVHFFLTREEAEEY